MNDNIQRAEESHTQPHQRAHAEAKITVHNSEAKPFDQTAKPALIEINLTETFTGDIDGESSLVEWSGSFTPVGVSNDEAIDLFHGIYKDGLEALQKAFID